MSQNSYTIPILSSIVIHAIIVIAIAAPMISPPKPDTSIQTTLVGQDDLAAAQQALQAHHQAQTQTTQSQRTDTVRTEFSNNQNYQVSHSATSLPAYIEEPALSFDIDAPSTIQTPVSTASDIPSADTEAAGRTDGGGGISAEDKRRAQQTVYDRIKSIWLSQPKQPNQVMRFVVRFDDAGNAIGIDFGGGNAELKSSIRTAVQSGGPYPEIAGLVKQMVFEFRTEQLIYDDTPAAGADALPEQ